jgi:hypothetical protein
LKGWFCNWLAILDITPFLSSISSEVMSFRFGYNFSAKPQD